MSARINRSYCMYLANSPCRVHELHLSLNGYNPVNTETAQTFQNIQKLYINGNNFSEWSEIAKLGQIFPSLQTLVMTENPVTTIDITSG